MVENGEARPIYARPAFVVLGPTVPSDQPPFGLNNLKKLAKTL